MSSCAAEGRAAGSLTKHRLRKFLPSWDRPVGKPGRLCVHPTVCRSSSGREARSEPQGGWPVASSRTVQASDQMSEAGVTPAAAAAAAVAGAGAGAPASAAAPAAAAAVAAVAVCAGVGKEEEGDVWSSCLMISGAAHG